MLVAMTKSERDVLVRAIVETPPGDSRSIKSVLRLKIPARYDPYDRHGGTHAELWRILYILCAMPNCSAPAF
jgi:hypothetical protein